MSEGQLNRPRLFSGGQSLERARSKKQSGEGAKPTRTSAMRGTGFLRFQKGGSKGRQTSFDRRTRQSVGEKWHAPKSAIGDRSLREKKGKDKGKIDNESRRPEGETN